jgi:hypothetical protein
MKMQQSWNIEGGGEGKNKKHANELHKETQEGKRKEEIKKKQRRIFW